MFCILDISNYKYHLAHHGTDRPWVCNECPKNYKTKIDLLQHQRVHDKARDPFHCDICNQFFRTRSNFNTHQRTHSVKGPQRCELCDKVFVNLRSHIQQVHHRVRQHICGVCDKAFGKKSGLDRHTITVHEKMRCWGCDVGGCEKSFGEKAQLLRHRKVHFRPIFQEPDPAQITEDQEIFSNKKRRMKCGMCKRILNSRSALKRHKTLVHEKKKTLLCDFCPRLFGEKSNLKRHILKSHTKEANLEDIKMKKEAKEQETVAIEKFPCSSCFRRFTTKWGLQAHEEVCRINQQERFNRQQGGPKYRRDSHAKYKEKPCEDIDMMEQVFLVADGSLEIKQEPPFMCDDTSNNSFEKFLPEESQVDAANAIEVVIKEEPLEEHLEDGEMKLPEFELPAREGIAFLIETDGEESEESEENHEDKPTVKRYKCQLCSSTFKEDRYFQSHMRTVHCKKKVLKCNIEDCDEVFVYRAQRLRHLRQKHPEFYEESDHDEEDSPKPSIECELCNSFFDTQEAFDIHIVRDHDENEAEDDEQKRTCELCKPPKVFKKTRYLLLHVQAVHSDQAYKCDQCERTFSFKRSLDRHIKGVHRNIRNFKCEEGNCDKTFCNAYELKQHMIGSHNRGDKSDRTCTICAKVFKKVKYLQIHCASIHNSEPQFTCPICDREFTFERSMIRHVKAIHEDRRDYKCDAEGCEKAFRSRYDLNEHFNNIHALVKKVRSNEAVTCDICLKVCSSKKVLYSHKKIIHEHVKWGLKYECKLCKEIFESKYKKSKHWGQVHRNGKIKMRTCQLCNSEFQLFDNFKAHVESHVGFSICIVCGACLPDESSLYLHLETHRKIEEELRQFVCDVCSHRLSTKAQLQVHMRKHSSVDHYMCDVSNFIHWNS